jgi:hypothetical protein
MSIGVATKIHHVYKMVCSKPRASPETGLNPLIQHVFFNQRGFPRDAPMHPYGARTGAMHAHVHALGPAAREAACEHAVRGATTDQALRILRPLRLLRMPRNRTGGDAGFRAPKLASRRICTGVALARRA